MYIIILIKEISTVIMQYTCLQCKNVKTNKICNFYNPGFFSLVSWILQRIKREDFEIYTFLDFAPKNGHDLVIFGCREIFFISYPPKTEVNYYSTTKTFFSELTASENG